MSSDNQLMVWIGCYACYNRGRLTGDWFPANEAASVTPEALHRRVHVRFRPDHEELHCFDHSGFPAGTGEMGPSTAQEWGEAYDEVDPEEWPAVAAWVESGAYVALGRGDVPSVTDFRDHYQGEYESFRSFAECLVEDTGMMQGWSEDAQRYFDWDSWTRDLSFDYTTAGSPTGGVYVFTNP